MKDTTKYIISSIILLIALFGAYYIYLNKTISDSVNEPIQVFDYSSKQTFNYAELKALKAPISLAFKLDNDMKYISNYMQVSGYSIDFDGDGKMDQTYDSNKFNDIHFKYDKPGTYNPKGKYKGVDKITGEKKEIEIKLPEIILN